jgi:hypothetical protein
MYELHKNRGPREHLVADIPTGMSTAPHPLFVS